MKALFFSFAICHIPLHAFATSPFDFCAPHSTSSSVSAQLDDAAPMIKAMPVAQDKRDLMWTDLKIDLNELKRMGGLSEKEILRSLRDDYQINVGVARPTSEEMQTIKSSLQAPTSASNIPQNLLDPSRATKKTYYDELENADPIILKFTQAFASQDGYGVFIRKGSDPLNAGTKARAHSIIFKDVAGKSVMIHEFAHFLIHQERERLGLTDPWAGPSDEERSAWANVERLKSSGADNREYQQALLTANRLQFERQMQTTGEELDVHRLTLEHRQDLKISDDTQGMANALVVYKQNLDSLKTSTTAMRAELINLRRQGLKAQTEAADLENALMTAERKIMASEKWFDATAAQMGYRFSPIDISSSVARMERRE